MSAASDTIGALVDEVSQALLDQYGLTWEHDGVPAEGASAQCAAVLGFSGDELRGVVGIVSDYAVLEESRRTLLGSVGTRGDVHDWAGELSNQLLGRLKNRLMKLGHTIHLATPMVLRGLQLEVRGAERPPIVHGFRTQHGKVWVWLDADLADGLVLDEVAAPDEGGMDEGDFMMF